MARPIIEDTPLVEPSTPWIRRFWVQAISMRTYTNTMFHPAHIEPAEYAQAAYRLPPDFTAITSLTLILWGAWTEAGSFDVRLSFGQPGEAYNVHTQMLNIAPAMVLNQLTAVDLAPTFAVLLANLAAGDVLLVNVRNMSAHGHKVDGVDGRYS